MQFYSKSVAHLSSYITKTISPLFNWTPLYHCWMKAVNFPKVFKAKKVITQSLSEISVSKLQQSHLNLRWFLIFCSDTIISICLWLSDPKIIFFMKLVTITCLYVTLIITGNTPIEAHILHGHMWFFSLRLKLSKCVCKLTWLKLILSYAS